jgi:hypothetical protein
MALILPIGRMGQCLALALCFLILAIAWIGALRPLYDVYTIREEHLAGIEAEAARSAAQFDTLPRLAEVTGSSSRNSAATFLRAGSDALAGAALQEQLQTKAVRSGALLKSIEMIPTWQTTTLHRIGLSVAISATLSQIVDIFARLEEGKVDIIIDDVRLTGTLPAKPDHEFPLDVAFTLYAFRGVSAKGGSP